MELVVVVHGGACTVLVLLSGMYIWILEGRLQSSRMQSRLGGPLQLLENPLTLFWTLKDGP